MELNFGFRVTFDRGTPFAFRSQEEAMRKFVTGLATLSALAVGLTMIGSRAEAAAIPAPGGLRAAIDTIALTETVQIYVFGGRRYCWYDDGWQGEGWYWGMSRFLLNIAKRSLPRLMLSGVGLANKVAV